MTADKIDKEIIVRNSKPEESFEALDGKQHKLLERICASFPIESGPLGFGGVM